MIGAQQRVAQLVDVVLCALEVMARYQARGDEVGGEQAESKYDVAQVDDRARLRSGRRIVLSHRGVGGRTRVKLRDETGAAASNYHDRSGSDEHERDARGR